MPQSDKTEKQRRREGTMRILFIVHRTPYPPNKGEKMRAFWELQALAKRHEVDLICFYDDPKDKEYAHELNQYCRHYYLEKLSYFWSRARAISALLLGKSFSTAFFCSRTMARNIKSAMDLRTYDKVLVFSSSMAQYVEATNNIPKLLDMVDVDSDKWEQYANRSRWPLSWVWRREARSLAAYESRLVRGFSTTVVCTDAEAELLRSKAPVGEIQVLENFLDVDQYDPRKISLSDQIRSWQPYVIFSGSMDYFPNVDAARYFCREVLPLIRSELPGTRFVIAGRNPHRSIAELGSDPAVQITGSVPDIKPYICGAAAAVVPMRIARGVQNKVLEALAGGIPVVSSTAAASALPENLRSLLVVADTPREFAAGVSRILRHGSDISSVELRGALKRHYENLDLQSQLDRLMLNNGVALKEESFVSAGWGQPG